MKSRRPILARAHSAHAIINHNASNLEQIYDKQVSVSVRPFNVNQVANGRFFYIHARSRSGKTTLIRNILHTITQRLDSVKLLVFSHGNEYQDITPNIHSYLDSLTVDMLIEHQRKHLGKDGLPINNIVIVVDNMPNNNLYLLLQQLASKARQLKITVILSSCNPSFPIIMKPYIEYMFVGTEVDDSYLNKLYNLGANTVFDSYHSFKVVYQTLLEINNEQSLNSIRNPRSQFYDVLKPHKFLVMQTGVATPYWYITQQLPAIRCNNKFQVAQINCQNRLKHLRAQIAVKIIELSNLNSKFKEIMTIQQHKKPNPKPKSKKNTTQSKPKSKPKPKKNTAQSNPKPKPKPKPKKKGKKCQRPKH